MADLFQSSRTNVVEHIKNIYDEGELVPEATCRNFRQVRCEGDRKVNRENCNCKDSPEKDGCYHCLYAYRQSNNIGSVSRKAAIEMIKAILSGKDNLEEIR